MATTPIYTRRRGPSGDQPVELRFVDMLLIIIATLVFVAVVLSVTSAFSNQTHQPRPVAAPRITTAAAPTAIIGRAYRLTLAASGGEGGLRWQRLAGSLPHGLSLSSDGTVQGTPVTRQDTRVTIEVSDSRGQTDRRELAFGTQPAGTGPRVPAAVPRIPATTSVLFAVEGQKYRHAFTTDTGTPPYRWTIRGKPLKGLSFGNDGTLVGRPADTGTGTFTVTVTDANGAKAQQNIWLEVRKGPKSTSEQIWDWVKKIWRILGWVVFIWLVLFGFGGQRIPGVIDFFRSLAGGRRREW
jgi:hypothetical protein